MSKPKYTNLFTKTSATAQLTSESKALDTGTVGVCPNCGRSMDRAIGNNAPVFFCKPCCVSMPIPTGCQ